MSKIAELWTIATSPDGGYLTNRAIRFIGHFVASAVVMYMAHAHTLDISYFMAYLAFICGDASMAQVLKTKSVDEQK